MKLSYSFRSVEKQMINIFNEFTIYLCRREVPSNDLRIAVIPEQMLLLSYTYWNEFDNKYNIQG